MFIPQGQTGWCKKEDFKPDASWYTVARICWIVAKRMHSWQKNLKMTRTHFLGGNPSQLQKVATTCIRFWLQPQVLQSLAESCSQNILEGSLAPDLRRLASRCPCRSFYAQTFGKGGDAWVELEAPWRSQQRHREEMTEFPELEEENRKL